MFMNKRNQFNAKNIDSSYLNMLYKFLKVDYLLSLILICFASQQFFCFNFKSFKVIFILISTEFSLFEVKILLLKYFLRTKSSLFKFKMRKFFSLYEWFTYATFIFIFPLTYSDSRPFIFPPEVNNSFNSALETVVLQKAPIITDQRNKR